MAPSGTRYGLGLRQSRRYRCKHDPHWPKTEIEAGRWRQKYREIGEKLKAILCSLLQTMEP
jgi:hypothetical protein